jgi:hypothetical protein
MSEPNDPILHAVLALSPEERVKLADHLREKLLVAHDAEIDLADVEYRIDALRCGDEQRLRQVRSRVRA